MPGSGIRADLYFLDYLRVTQLTRQVLFLATIVYLEGHNWSVSV
jgi:hypothetical protein